jgi:hypothetical protein
MTDASRTSLHTSTRAHSNMAPSEHPHHQISNYQPLQHLVSYVVGFKPMGRIVKSSTRPVLFSLQCRVFLLHMPSTRPPVSAPLSQNRPYRLSPSSIIDPPGLFPARPPPSPMFPLNTPHLHIPAEQAYYPHTLAAGHTADYTAAARAASDRGGDGAVVLGSAD